MAYYRCFSCEKVFPLMGENENKCPSCEGANGEVISAERVKEGMEAGVYYNIDPKTGKRAKKKK